MTVNISSDHEQLIAEAIQAGTYENPCQMIERALEVLRAEDQWIGDHNAAIRQKIEHAFEQSERGELLSAEEARAEMKARKAAWLSNRRG